MTEPTHGPDDLGEGTTMNPTTSEPATPHVATTGANSATGHRGAPETADDQPTTNHTTHNGATTQWHTNNAPKPDSATAKTTTPTPATDATADTPATGSTAGLPTTAGTSAAGGPAD